MCRLPSSKFEDETIGDGGNVNIILGELNFEFTLRVDSVPLSHIHKAFDLGFQLCVKIVVVELFSQKKS